MNSKAFIVFLIVSLLVSLGLLIFFAKRHPNPRFRPKRGEVFLLSIFLVFLSSGFSFFMSQLFEQDWDLNKLNKGAADELSNPTSGGEGPKPPGSDSGKDSESDSDENLPPFMKKE